jgi:hypothetical protein
LPPRSLIDFDLVFAQRCSSSTMAASLLKRSKLLRYMTETAAKHRASESSNCLTFILGEQARRSRLRPQADPALSAAPAELDDGTADDDGDSAAAALSQNPVCHDELEEEEEDCFLITTSVQAPKLASAHALRLADCGKGFASAARDADAVGYLQGLRANDPADAAAGGAFAAVQPLHHHSMRKRDSPWDRQCVTIGFQLQPATGHCQQEPVTVQASFLSYDLRQHELVRGSGAVLDALSLARGSSSSSSSSSSGGWDTWDLQLDCADSACDVAHAFVDASEGLLRQRVAPNAAAGGQQLLMQRRSTNTFSGRLTTAEPWSSEEAAAVTAEAAEHYADVMAVSERLLSGLNAAVSTDTTAPDAAVFRALLQCDDTVRIGGDYLLAAMLPAEDAPASSSGSSEATSSSSSSSSSKTSSKSKSRGSSDA